MALRRKTSGLRLYSFLKKEVYAANKNRKKPISAKKIDALLKKKIFPKYKDTPLSKVKKNSLRADISRTISNSTRKKSYAGLIYNKILHEVSVINEKIPEIQRLTIKERRKLVSEVLYPLFKGQKLKEIDWDEVVKRSGLELRKLKKDVCDILSIPENLYQRINYFEIDDFIARVLPPCIYTEVNAGPFGRTGIFNTRDYNYYDTGLQQITGRINKAVAERKLAGDTNNLPKYAGEIQLRPDKKNDGNSENYYLEMILVINDELVDEPETVVIPKRKISSKKQKQQKATREYVNTKLKRLKAEKSKVKPIRQRISRLEFEMKSEIKVYSRLVKKGIISQQKVKELLKGSFQDEKKKLNAYREKKIISDYQYKELFAQIKRIYNQ